MSDHAVLTNAAIVLRLTPTVALTMIADGGCENYTSGTCESAGRHPLALYGAEAWCAPCIASAALGWNADRRAENGRTEP